MPVHATVLAFIIYSLAVQYIGMTVLFCNNTSITEMHGMPPPYSSGPPAGAGYGYPGYAPAPPVFPTATTIKQYRKLFN